MDTITIDRIKTLHPRLQDDANDIYFEICKAISKNAICRFAYTYRSNKEQDELFKKVPKVTNARGGQSYHNYGLAIDIVFLIDKDGNGTYETASWNNKLDADKDGVADWMEVVKIFKSYGWEWGGDWHFKDMPHFQKTYGLSIKQLQAKTKGLGGTNYLI